ncbi:MAG: DNA-directed RNA polymerase subunit A' [Candidatus Njordarchaeales archaeon]
MYFEIPKKLASIRFGIMSPEEIRKLAVVRIDQSTLYDDEGRGFPGSPLDRRLGSPDNRERCEYCGLRRREGETGCIGHFGYISLAMPVYHLGFVKYIEKVLNAICERCGRLTLPPEKREKYWAKMKEFIDRYGYPSPEIAKEVLNEAIKEKKCYNLNCGHEKVGKFIWSKEYLTFIKRIEIPPEKLEEIKKSEKSSLSAYLIGRRRPRIVKGRGNKYYENQYLTAQQIKQILETIYDPKEDYSPEEREERRKDVFLLGFHPDYALPQWTILQDLPVPPITVRPPVVTADGKRSEDHLTITLRDIVRINEQLKNKLRGGPSPVIESNWQKLQKLVMVLFGLHKVGEIKLESLYVKGIVHRLSGKEGRFRHNLSGKRVDFSGRAVISPDPYLSVDEIGVPEKMARVLIVPEVVNELNIERLRQLVINGPDNYPGAVFIWQKRGEMYHKISLEVFKGVEERKAKALELKPGDIVERHLMDGDIVVFNRQPTLHRISMMGHYVRVLPYNTLRLHLHSCPPYNADFDGDEMNIHLPRSLETRAEISTIMEVKRHIITPRYGGPIIGPKQDYITGAYLLTKDDTLLSLEEAVQILFYAGITSLPEPTTVIGREPYWSGKDLFSQIIPRYIFYEKDVKGALCGKKGSEKCKVKIWDGKILEGVIDKNAIGAEKPENLVQRIIDRWGYEAGKKFLNSMGAMIIRYLTDRGFSLTLWDIKLPAETREKIRKVLAEYIEKANNLVRQYLEGKLEPDPGKTLEDTFEDKLVEILDEARTKAGEIVMESMPMDSQFLAMTVTGARGDETNIQQVLACIGQPVVRGKRLRRGYDQRTLPHFKKGDVGPYAGGFTINSFSSGMSPIEYFFHNAGGRDSLVDTAVRTADSGYFYRRLVNALQDSRIEYDGTARMMSGHIVQFRYGGDGIHPGKSFHGKLTDYESLFYEIIVRREDNGKKVKTSRKTWPKYYDEVIEEITEKTSKAIAEDIRKIFKDMLKKGYVLSEEEVKEYKEKILEKYLQAQIDPGEAAGTVAAQSVSEPATQLTLRTFHWAGVAAFSITTGLPRLKEIFDAVERPSTPMISVYLESDYKRSKKKAEEIFSYIRAVTILHLIKQDGLQIEPGENRIKVVLSRERLRHYNLTPEIVKEKIEKIGKVRVEHPSSYILYIYPADTDVSLTEIYRKLREKVFKGFKEYERAQLRKSDEFDEYYIVIAGSDITPLLYVKGVDVSRLETNNIHMFAKIFGIEAARRLIAKEAKNVLDQYGLDVDMRHILYITDVMTMHGHIEAIGRYGIAGKKLSVLARAAFEETGKHLFRAAAAGMVDPLLGATENVIVGGVPPLGTGVVKLGFFKKPIKQNQAQATISNS